MHEEKGDTPGEPAALAQDLHVSGLALAACDKSVQWVYEHALRPEDKRHAPWVERVTGQLPAALDALEQAAARRALPTTSATMTQAGVSTAVAWEFLRQMVPQLLPAGRWPVLQRFGTIAEALPEFAAAPHGEGTFRWRD